ncbi:MAG: hypothetical protein H6767_04165 [Candidatus Peribacteria bacterium]|nr:MAG: hypothetical protein H6767_04165 [Candidatus Peribacteria bacterium]
MAATAHTSFSELMKTGVTVYVDYKPELKSYIHGSPYFQEQELYTWVISDGTEGYVLVCTPDEYISISSQL